MIDIIYHNSWFGFYRALIWTLNLDMGILLFVGGIIVFMVETQFDV